MRRETYLVAARGLWVAIAFAAAALPGCGGSSGVTNQGAVGTPLPSSSVSATPVPGASQELEITQAAGGTLSLGPYPNASAVEVTLQQLQFGAGTLTNQNMTFLQGWISNGESSGADVYPTNASWTAYTGSGNVVIYFELEAQGVATFSSYPALTFTTGTAVTGTSCAIGQFSLTSGTWGTVLSGGTIGSGGTTVTFAAQAGSFVVGNPGNATYNADYFVLTCQ